MSDYNMLYFSLWKVLIDIWHFPKWSAFLNLFYSLSLTLFIICTTLIILLFFFNIHVVHKGITQEPEINYPVHRPNQSSLICNSCLFKKRLVFKSDRHNYAGKWGEKMEENNYILDLRMCKIPPAGETQIVLATFLARLATKWTWGRKIKNSTRIYTPHVSLCTQHMLRCWRSCIAAGSAQRSLRQHTALYTSDSSLHRCYVCLKYFY